MADVSEARDLLAAVQGERARGKKIRTTIVVALLCGFGLFFGKIYIDGKNFDADGFVASLEREASAKVFPAYQRTLTGVANDAVPAISDALAAEAGTLLPRVSEKLAAESGIFQTRMSEHMQTSLEGAIASAVAQHKDALKARYPEFSGDEDTHLELLGRLQTAAQHWAQDELDTTFGNHIHLLQSINETVMKLQNQAASERADGGERGVEDVLTIMAEIMNARVAGE
jgi:hypothetical protein